MTESIKCDIKTPKRVLHFSDGVLEEYDSNEDNPQKETTSYSNQQLIVSNSLVSYLMSSVFWFGSQTLKVCDYLGEGLANLLGITSPKYEYEIQELKNKMNTK